MAGIVGYTHALFRSVLIQSHSGSRSGNIYLSFAASVSRALGGFVVGRYAAHYLRLTRPLDRRTEVAADVLSARFAGRAAAIRALETISTLGPLFDAYLTNHVGDALDHGAMPSDVLPGFDRFRAKVTERGLTATLQESIRARATDRAIDFVADRPAFDTWTMHATLDLFTVRGKVANRLWSELPREAYAPSLTKRAAAIVEALRARYPAKTTTSAMFRRVCYALAQGEASGIVSCLAPSLGQHPHRVALSNNAIAGAQIVLFRGALLEHGATVDASLGEPCLLFSLNGERVAPDELVDAAMTRAVGAEALQAWADRLCAPEHGATKNEKPVGNTGPTAGEVDGSP